MSMRLPLVAMVLSSSMLALVCSACGPAPGTHARTPAGGVRVVPADQVKGTCRCDDDDDEYDIDVDAPPARRPIEYVKLSDWQPPPQVAEIEAAIPPRGDEPARFTTFPQLTLHRPIESSSYRRLGRYAGYESNVHAR